MRKIKSLQIVLLGTLCLLFTQCSKSDDANPSGDNEPDNAKNIGPVGSSANDLLSAENYNFLVVEVQYAAGYAPPGQSINYLQNFLNNRLNKPAGITVNVTEVEAPGQSSYSISELRAMEDEKRTQFTNGSKMAVYIYLADGSYDQNNNVLGVAHRNTSIVLFQKRIEEVSGGVGQVSTSLLTSTVLAHEVGHLLGLVNNGSPMQTNHHDSANGAHCTAEDCLMYFSVESTSGLSDLLGMSSPPDLDANCLADLSANGGK